MERQLVFAFLYYVYVLYIQGRRKINSGIQDSLSIWSMASNSAPPRRSMAAERGCVNLRYYAERGV